MDLENLKTFLEVHQTRHFGHAADNLFITSAAVSARIKQLEQYLGVTLFLRNRGNVQLTGAGERLLPHAQHLLSTWARTLQAISPQNDTTSRLHIGATPGLWQFALSQSATSITQARPDLSLQAEAHANNELVTKLLERSLDLAVLYEPPNLPELKVEKIGHLKLNLASSTDNQSVTSALKTGYIYVDWGESFAVFHANRFGEVPPARLHVNFASIAVDVITAFPGSAYLPRSFIDSHAFLHRVKGAPTFSRTIYASYHQSHSPPELLTGVVNLLKGLAI